MISITLFVGEFEVVLCVDNSESTASRKYGVNLLHSMTISNVLISLHVHVCIYRSSTQFRGILLADLGKNGKQLLFSMQMYMYKTNYKLGLICRSSV